MTFFQRLIRRFAEVPENIRGNFEAVSDWLRVRSYRGANSAQVDESGLIKEYSEEAADKDQVDVVVRKTDGRQSLERMQEGLNRLVEELSIINSTLNEHVAGQRQLMERMENLPRLVENFPNAIQNQQHMMEILNDQFRASTEKMQQFVENIKRLPDESIRQTDTLISINRQLSAAADADLMLNENFSKFNSTIDKLNQATLCHTDSVAQMTRTFAESDRYLKYMVAKQNKRFMLVFMVAMGVSVLAIISLITVIAFIR